VITHRGFVDTQLVSQGETVVYGTGQPMGAYSSWALLALVHHALVQYSAHLVGNVGWFEDYCVLGDDIVIADTAVGEQYLKVIAALGVSVNLSKSLQSKKGVFEFAKRIATPTTEYSPIPWGAYYQALRTGPAIMPTFVRWLISHGFDLSPLSLAIAAPSWFGIPRELYNEATEVNSLPTTVQLILVELMMRGAPWFIREGLLIDIFQIRLGELSKIVSGATPYMKPNPAALFESVLEWLIKEVRIVVNPVNWIRKVIPSEEASPKFVGGFLRPFITLVSPYGICSYYRWASLIGDVWSSFRKVVARGVLRLDLGILWREMITHLLLSYVIRKDTRTPYGLWSASSKYASILPQPPKIRTETDRAASTAALSSRFAARTLRTYARHVMRLPSPRNSPHP